MAVLYTRRFKSETPHAGRQRDLYSSTNGRKLKSPGEENYRYSAATYDQKLKNGTIKYRSFENQIFDPTSEH